MSRPRIGVLVVDVRGRHLGRVVAINHCCIQTDKPQVISSAGIFAITESEVELICDSEQISRYACPIHKVADVAKQPQGNR